MSINYDIVTQNGVSKVTSQAVLRDLEADDLEGAFTMHVTHGHLIRSLVHVLRDILSYGILEFTPTTLRLLRVDKTERVIVSIDIDTSKFFQYLFVSKKGIIRVGISFSVLWQCIKVIGKQDSFIMSKMDGDEHVVLDFGNAARQQYALQGVCEQHIEIPTYLSRQPNVYITVKELTKAMSYLRTERGRAHIKGFRDRVVVEALNGRKVQRMGTSFDDVWRRIGLTPDSLLNMMRENPTLSCSLHANEDHSAIVELEIAQNYPKYGGQNLPTLDALQSHLVLKSLSKVYTIAPNSSVLATVEVGQPIRIVIPVGEYGTLTLYLLTAPWSGSGECGDLLSPDILSPASVASTPMSPDGVIRSANGSSRAPRSGSPEDGLVTVDATVDTNVDSSIPVPALVPARPRRRPAAPGAARRRVKIAVAAPVVESASVLESAETLGIEAGSATVLAVPDVVTPVPRPRRKPAAPGAVRRPRKPSTVASNTATVAADVTETKEVEVNEMAS